MVFNVITNVSSNVFTVVLLTGFLILSGCAKVKPTLTAKKDLSNSSKPTYECKIEVYREFDIEAIWKKTTR